MVQKAIWRLYCDRSTELSNYELSHNFLISVLHLRGFTRSCKRATDDYAVFVE